MKDDERKNILEDISRGLDNAELFYVASIYLDPELLYEYTVPITSFSKKSHYAFYYGIAYNMIIKEKYEALDNLSVDTYVEQRSKKTKDRYESLGGYNTISIAMEVVDERNIQAIHENVLKYHTIRKLLARGWDIPRIWDKIKGYTLQQLQTYIESQVNESFIDNSLTSDEHVEDLTHGLKEMVKEANRGDLMGMPYNSNLVNSVLNGMKLGEATFLAAMSGVGKTYLTTLLTVVGLIKQQEKVLIIANEEGKTKFQRELLTYVCNNEISLRSDYFKGTYIEKSRFFVGNFSRIEAELLSAGIKWMEENIPDGTLNFIELNSFSTDKSIKIIKRHALTKGIKYFVIDTFKHDNDINSSKSDNSWLDLQQSSVKLYNTIKESNLNVHLMMTYQLSKTKRKYLDQTSLGNAKNVIDIASTLILVRPMMVSEKENIEVYNTRGDLVNIDKDLDYMVLFFDKNRSGSVSRQVVLRVDYARNMFADVGTTQISEDF